MLKITARAVPDCSGDRYGTEVGLNEASFTPYLSTTPSVSYERRTLSASSNLVTGSYYEVYTWQANDSVFDISLATQATGASNATLCATAGDQGSACDYVAETAGAWAYNGSGSASFSTTQDWINNGGYYWSMNGETSLGYTQYYSTATTYGEQTYLANYNATNLGNTIVWASGGALNLYPFSGLNVTIDLQNVFMIKQFSGCTGSGDPALICTVWEAHLYGQSSADNSCAQHMGLGEIGVVINQAGHYSGYLTYETGIVAD